MGDVCTFAIVTLLIANLRFSLQDSVKHCIRNVTQTEKEPPSVSGWRGSFQRDLMSCVQLCMRQAGCSSVSFDEIQSQCLKYTEDDPDMTSVMIQKGGILYTSIKHCPRREKEVICTFLYSDDDGVPGSTEKSFTDSKADGINTSDEDMTYLGYQTSEFDNATGTAEGFCIAGFKASVSCDKIRYRAVGTYCLILMKVKHDWDSASKECDTREGHLVIINSVNKLRATIKMIRNDLDESRFWIGLYGKKNSHHFIWVDGQKLNYSNWWPGEPNHFKKRGGGRRQKCVEMTKKGGWNDERCKKRQHFICEQNQLAP